MADRHGVPALCQRRCHEDRALTGKTTRIGLRKCYACRKPFTAKVGTIFEDSHAPLQFWLRAIFLMCYSKKGISTRQLQRSLGVGMKTAWFMGHRIRHAMGPVPDAGPIGGEGKTVETDENYLSKSPKTRKAPDTALNAKPAPQVFSLVKPTIKLSPNKNRHRLSL